MAFIDARYVELEAQLPNADMYTANDIAVKLDILDEIRDFVAEF